MRCGMIFSYPFTENLQLSLPVTDFSYCNEFVVFFILEHRVDESSNS